MDWQWVVGREYPLAVKMVAKRELRWVDPKEYWKVDLRGSQLAARRAAYWEPQWVD